MRIRSAIVVGSFAAASGAYPQLSIPPEAGKGANSKWHLPPRISPARRRHGWPERCARAAARPRAARRAEITPLYRRLLGRRRRRRRRAEEERQGPATGVRRLSNGLYRSLLRQRRDHAVAFVASPPATRPHRSVSSPHRPRPRRTVSSSGRRSSWTTSPPSTPRPTTPRRPRRRPRRRRPPRRRRATTPPATRSSRRSPWARASRTWAKSSPSGGSRAFIDPRRPRRGGPALEGG